MRLTGQAVTFVPEVFSRICILGAANHGDYTGQAMLVYEDGTTQNIAVSFSDWCGGPSKGEDIAFTFPSRYDNTGNIERIKCMLYYRCAETPRQTTQNHSLSPDSERPHIRDNTQKEVIPPCI